MKEVLLPAVIVELAGPDAVNGAGNETEVPVKERFELVKYQLPVVPIGVNINFIVVPGGRFCKADIPDKVELPGVPVVPDVTDVFQVPTDV